MTDIVAPPPHRPGDDWLDEEVDRGLAALAMCSGNTRRAAKALKDAGLPIPRDTLQRWKRDRAERYLVIQEEQLPAVYARIAENNEDLAESLTELEVEIAQQLRDKLASGDIEPRDLANALRSTSTSKAINIDKASVIRGRPTEIRRDQSVNDVLRTLSRRFGHIISVNETLIDSTAEEITPDADTQRDV